MCGAAYTGRSGGRLPPLATLRWLTSGQDKKEVEFVLVLAVGLGIASFLLELYWDAV